MYDERTMPGIKALTTVSKKDKKKILRFAFLALAVFVFALNIPKISLLIIFAVFFVSSITWRGEIISDLLVQVSLLGMFSIMYYLIIYNYGFTDLISIIKYPILIMGSYSIGYSISQKNTPDWPHGLVWILLSMATGFVVFSFLSVYAGFSSGHSVEILYRSAPGFWTSGESINGPILGLFASLGLSLAPVLFFGRGQFLGKRHLIVLLTTISFLVAAGVYVNTALQNRSPFIALLVSFVGSVFLYFFIKKHKLKHKIKTVFFISIFLGIVFSLFFYRGYDYSQSLLVNRFEVQGLETGRFTAWMSLLKALPENLGGGRLVYIGELGYVHNLWLDVAYDAGILPVIFLLIFHAVHLKSLVALVHSRLPILPLLVILCLGVSILVGFMVEPVIQGSVMYFSATCFFFGLVRRLYNDIRLVHT